MNILFQIDQGLRYLEGMVAGEAIHIGRTWRKRHGFRGGYVGWG